MNTAFLERNLRNGKRTLLAAAVLLVTGPRLFAENYYSITKVEDGDTITIDSGDWVRLIGVDAPELKHPDRDVRRFARESKAFVKKLCGRKKVRLEFDEDRVDKYDRVLAYVFLEDGTFVNAEIIRKGYARTLTWFPFKYKKDFKEYQEIAEKVRIGLWADGKYYRSKGNFPAAGKRYDDAEIVDTDALELKPANKEDPGGGEVLELSFEEVLRKRPRN
ncbi:MAG: thermonuclease family protein [Candidatus Omnitrophota bacterium]